MIKPGPVKDLIDKSPYNTSEYKSVPFNLFLMHAFERYLLAALAESIFPKNGRILEIGSYYGYSIVVMKEANHSLDITGVDPYYSNKELENRTDTKMNNVYDKALKLLSKTGYYPHDIRILRGPSPNIVETFQDDYFDVIFIDGDHSYDSLRRDILVSYSKLKNNGILFGHDASHDLVSDCVKNYIVSERICYNIPNRSNPYTLRFKDIEHRMIGIDIDATDTMIHDFWFARVIK